MSPGRDNEQRVGTVPEKRTATDSSPPEDPDKGPDEEPSSAPTSKAAPPQQRATSPDQAGRTRVLNVLVLAMLVMDLCYCVTLLALWGEGAEQDLIVALSFAAVTVTALWLGRRGSVKLAGVLVVVVLLMLFSDSLARYGLGSPLLFALMTAVVVAVLVVDTATAIGTVVTGVALYFAFGWARTRGLLPPSPPPEETLMASGVLTGLALCMVLFLVRLSTTQLRSALARSTREYRLLLATNRTIENMHRARSPETVFDVLVAEARELGHLLTIYVLDQSHSTLALVRTSIPQSVQRAAEKLVGVTASSFSVPVAPGGLFARVVAGETIFFDNAATIVAEMVPATSRGAIARAIELLGLGAGIVSPLLIDGRPYGCLIVSGTAITSSDTVAVEVFAHQASTAIENAKLYAEAEERAIELQRLAIVMASSNDAVIVTDLDGTITEWNEAATRMCGYSRQEAVGKSTIDLVPDESKEQARKLLALATEAGHRRIDMQRLSQDGRVVDVSVTVSPLCDSGGAVFAIATTERDVTEERQAAREREQLQAQLVRAQKMEAIGRLAGGVAHDFNNLLSVVLSYSDFIESSDVDDSTRADIREIKHAGERAARLTRQLLAFSKRRPTNPSTVDLNPIVAEMDKMLRRIVGEDIELVTRLDEQLGKVLIDPSQVEQILANLVINARDAMPEGGSLSLTTAAVEVEEQYARTHLGVEPGPYAVLSVSDSGIGMDREVLAHIFEPFYTTKAEGKGTGLGLATVYGIVKQAGGTISVYSEPGHGTTFKVFLPAAKDGEQGVETTAQPVPKRADEARTVLVVEDEDAVRKLAVRLLEGHGYTVLAAANGPEAVAIVESRKGPIDLLLTDVIMPGMTGVQLAEKVGQLVPGLPVLLMSGYTDHVLIHNGFVEDGVRFIDKPLSKAKLLGAVEAALRR